ncbi:MAG: hypothetical protein ACTSUE_13080 [Promethearchaeota archaeon]
MDEGLKEYEKTVARRTFKTMAYFVNFMISFIVISIVISITVYAEIIFEKFSYVSIFIYLFLLNIALNIMLVIFQCVIMKDSYFNVCTCYIPFAIVHGIVVFGLLLGFSWYEVYNRGGIPNIDFTQFKLEIIHFIAAIFLLVVIDGGGLLCCAILNIDEAYNMMNNAVDQAKWRAV